MRFDKSNRLPYLNFLRAKYESFIGEILVKSYPYIMEVDASSFCQLRCPLCPTGIENENRRSGQSVTFRNRSLMTADLYDALLDELGDYLFLIMFYNWGEPLLNKNLPGFISKAKKLDICTEIHTNLSLPISDQHVEELLLSGIDEIAASIDGFSQESYQTYRRGGKYELARSNLERLAKVRDRLGLKTNIVWNFLVFSFNEHEIEATRQYCDQLGITFNQRDAFVDNPDWLPSYRKGELKQAKSSATPDEPPAPAVIKPRSKSSCAWHYCYSLVNADGSVSPCCAPWEQKHDFGKVQPGVLGFADIWNNNSFRKSRGAFARKEVKGLSALDTLCLQCPFDDAVQNLFSLHDPDIRRRFQRDLQSSDPLLEQAFSLLDDKARFVEFFEHNLITDFSPVPSESAEPKTGKSLLTGNTETVYDRLAARSRPFGIGRLKRYITERWQENSGRRQ